MNLFPDFSDWAEIANLLAAVVTIAFHLFSKMMLHRRGIGEQIISNIQKLIEAVKKEADSARKISREI
ncbi:hypothetical protein IP79_09200 [Porphyrobacter sp. AAP60]|nr:hypothetical protein IP79_09200 [Porphyrobacter sp. AAP60]